MKSQILNTVVSVWLGVFTTWLYYQGQSELLTTISDAHLQNESVYEELFIKINTQLLSQKSEISQLKSLASEASDMLYLNYDPKKPTSYQGGESSPVIENEVFLDDVISNFKRINTDINLANQNLSDVIKGINEKEEYSRNVLSGYPVKTGWISSPFGQRVSPFTGFKQFHKGIDIASTQGSEIFSIGPGIVTFAGKKGGYGNLVEVKHLNGFISRYGHCSQVLVKTGELVSKEQMIAYVGSSGRSTGAHVHIELRKNNIPIDPKPFIQR